MTMLSSQSSQSSQIAWGARSGIQKAIRRQDIGLAKFCFDLLWENASVHRFWLIPNRITAIVAEDCWQFAGELAVTQNKSLVTRDEKTLYDLWRRFTLRLAAYPSNKEAGGWLYHAMRAEQFNFTSTDPRFLCMRELLDLVRQRNGKPELLRLASDIMPVLAAYFDKTFSAYEADACRVLAARIRPDNWTGFLDDKLCCLAAIMLIGAEGLDRAVIQANLKEALGATRVKPYTELPWYCYDQHTRVGKRALSVVLKKENPDKLTEEQLRCLLFYCSSALIPQPSPMWSAFSQRVLAAQFGSTENALRLWKKYRPICQALIEWSMRIEDEKR